MLIQLLEQLAKAERTDVYNAQTLLYGTVQSVVSSALCSVVVGDDCRGVVDQVVVALMVAPGVVALCEDDALGGLLN